MHKKLQKSDRKSGFTLVEVIAVLVILAILTAVAVPKYFDLTEQAKEKALQGALAEGKSVCSLAYSRLSLETATAPTAVQVATEASSVNIEGDFSFAFDGSSGTGVDITVLGVSGSVSGSTTNAIWTVP